MLEICARAICNRRLPKPSYDADAFDNLKTWAEPGIEHWEDSKAELDGFYADARAVIEALMWPSRPMRDAGTAVITHADLEGEFPMSIDVFRAMIHEALRTASIPNEEGEGT